jgi:hypothetical protein
VRDGNSSGTIPMGINGGGAMDGRMAATVKWQLPLMLAAAMGDGNGSSTIAMGDGGGSAMDGRTAVQ